MNTYCGYWHATAGARWNRYVDQYTVVDQIDVPYLKNALYIARPYKDYDTFFEYVCGHLVGKGYIEFSDLTSGPHKAFFVAKAAYAFEVHDITDHWFGDDD